jgi:hypothetical protein
VIYTAPPDSAVETLVRQGHLALFPDLPLSELELLRTLPMHAVERWKKLKSRDVLAPLPDAIGDKHPISVWTRDKAQAQRIQTALRVTENEVRALMQRWFPSVQFKAELHSWRYTLTKDEPLHFDAYAERVKAPVLRLFLNLDTQPRVWDLGPIAGSEAERGTYDPVFKANLISGVPVERVEFAPGSAWIVESYRVAHAIIFGRRAAMFSFET